MDKAELQIFLKEYFHTLGGWVVAITVLGNLATWLTQYLFSLSLQKRQNTAQTTLEGYKNELQNSVTKLTSELSALNKKQEVAFTWLHTTKAKVMVNTYHRLAGMQYALQQIERTSALIGGGQKNFAELGSLETMTKELRATCENYLLYIKQREFLYDDKTALYLVQAGAQLLKYALYHTAKLMGDLSNPDDYKEFLGRIDIDEINDSIEKSLLAIRTRFRTALEAHTEAPSKPEKAE